MLSESDLQRSGELLDRRFGLDALWLYGSEAKGTAGPESDVDLAALFRRRPTALELIDAEAELGDLFRKPTQVVDLARASPILAMQVLRYGRLLAEPDRARRIAFTVKTISMYEDLKIMRREPERALLERLRR